MSKAFFTVRNVLTILFLSSLCFSVIPARAVKEKPIVITSQTLTADNRKNTAVFEGSVVATSEDIVIYSDRMEVSYNDSAGEIIKIHAYGNVKVQKDERAIFAEEAIYLGQEEKIIFKGEPKVVDGDNVISGTQIIYFFKDERAVVESSNVTINSNQK